MLRPIIRNHSFDRMGENFAHLIDGDHFLGRSSLGMPRHKVAANVVEEQEEYTLELAVPGFKREELEIILEKEVLLIAGKRATVAGKNDKRYLVNEFGVESFERMFKLAPDIADDRIHAKLEDGVLTVRFFKSDEATAEAKKTIAVQ